MSLVIIAIAAVAIVCVVILLSLTYKHDQSLVCPQCELGFTTDLYFLQQNTLVACPFCHRWMIVMRVKEKNVVKKLFP